ncbi:MAG: SurA N-terminal domain-containing protein [Oscillospiraceae bacterium]|nr:SurA N-terminal domain-containing protein [Oscillospiraceae bacterium]
MDEKDEKKELGDYLFEWKRKFDNFIYHNKIAIIFGVIILAFIIFAVSQCAGKTQGDADIAYIGGHEIGEEHYNNLRNALREILGEDLNGDGEIYADFTHFMYMTESQIENARARGRAVNMQSVMTAQTQIQLELAQGNIVIYFIDPEVYRELSAGDSGIFMPVDEILGYRPESANDDYSIRLGNLQCWQYYEGLNDFPANTLVAVRDMYTDEKIKGETIERYERNFKTLKNLIEFEYIKDAGEED